MVEDKTENDFQNEILTVKKQINEEINELVSLQKDKPKMHYKEEVIP